MFVENGDHTPCVQKYLYEQIGFKLEFNSRQTQILRFLVLVGLLDVKNSFCYCCRKIVGNGKCIKIRGNYSGI
jgi:hypothetical protein